MTHRLIVNGELVLYGDVGDMFFGLFDHFTAREVLEALSEMEGPVTVRLNSGGGFTDEGAAIHNALKLHTDPVTVMVDGIAASAASVIAMAGSEIVMADGAMMMIHDPGGVTQGNAATHAKTVDILNKIADTMAGIYAKRTGKTADAIRVLMRDETWMTPAEAVEQGFADQTSEDAAASAAAFEYRIYAHAPEHLRALAAEKCGNTRIEPVAAVASLRTPAGRAAMQKEMVDMTQKPTESPAPAVTDEKIAAAADLAVKAERERVRAIRTVGMSLDIADAEITASIDAGTSATDFQETAIATVAERKKTTGHGIRTQTAAITVDEHDRFRAGAAKGVLVKAGHKDGERNEFTGMTLRELARESLMMAGESARHADVRTMIGRAFTMANGSHSTSDFPSILADVAHKMMLMGFEEAEETFATWTRPGVLTDFKVASRVDIGTFPALQAKPEGAEYKYITVGERKETIALATYGSIFPITREAVINDDLGAFTRIPRKMGLAANRTVGDLVYAVLTGNPNMSDGVALFHASHSNLAAAGAAPSVTTWDAARTAMAIQKDGGATVNVRPRYTLVPVALEGVSRTLAASEFDPAKTQRVPNHVRGMVEVISDARLDANSAAAYYFAGDPSVSDTVEVAYLNGEQNPFMEERTAWSTDGAEFKVRMDAGVAPLDFRSLFKNPGQ